MQWTTQEKWIISHLHMLSVSFYNTIRENTVCFPCVGHTQNKGGHCSLTTMGHTQLADTLAASSTKMWPVVYRHRKWSADSLHRCALQFSHIPQVCKSHETSISGECQMAYQANMNAGRQWNDSSAMYQSQKYPSYFQLCDELIKMFVIRNLLWARDLSFNRYLIS